MFVKLLQDWKGKPAGETIDLPEDFARQLGEQKIAEPLVGDPLPGLIHRSLEQATSQWTQSMDQALARTLQKFQDVQGQARKHAVPAIFGEGGTGDPKRNFGDWACAVARDDRSYLEKFYGSSRVDYTGKAALAEASPFANAALS